MTIYAKPNYTAYGVWASDGNIVAPDSDKIELGHVVEKPKNEYMNWIQNRQDQGIAYTLQKGIPDWDNFTEYPKNAVIDFNGITYRAKNQHTGRQPNNNPANWEVAFADFSVVSEINRIKNEDGYLGLYVQKSSPVMIGRALGNGFAAASGDVVNSGYSFKDSDNTGMYYKDNKLIFKLNGTILGTFNGGTSDDDTVVTLSQVKQMLEDATRIKVGDLYFTTVVGDPTERLGYGEWEKYAQGRALVGHSEDVTSESPDWVKLGGKEFGEYSTELVIDNIPDKTFSFPADDQLITSYNLAKDVTRPDTAYDAESNPASPFKSGWAYVPKNTSANAATLPHNNVQPSIVIYVWKRIS